MLAMTEEFLNESSLLWGDEEPWAFPILGGEDDAAKNLIEGGKILTQREEEAAPVLKGKKKRGSATATSKKDGGGDGGGGGDSDEHELHIWTERERRKKMRNMFANLHALIPNIHPRADKSTIIDEAIVYIKQLHLNLESLERLKKERMRGGITNPSSCDTSSIITQPNLREAYPADQGSTTKQPSPNLLLSGPTTFKTWTSPNVILNICGKDAHINVCCPKKPGFMTAIFFVMEKYKLDVVSAQVSTDHGARMYMIHVRAHGQFPEAFLVEELYKQAAAEIMLWLNT